MEEMIYTDLMEKFRECFKTHPELLPTGVKLENVNIIGGVCELPSRGKTEIQNHEVVFRGDLGDPEWLQNYDLVFDGLELIDVRRSHP